MPPNAKSQHTTFSRSRCWCHQCQADRPPEGRGQLFIPLWQPHPQECGCQQCFRLDVHQSERSSGRLRRCEPPPSRKVFPKVNVLSGTACATVLPACPFSAACPAPHINCFFGEAQGPRPPAWNRLRRSPSFNASMRRDGGGSHRLRRPSRVHLSPRNCGINSAVPHVRCMMSQRCTRLDTAPSSC